jgi:Domain of unknown function (DUF5914)/Rieske [2Fe-2S] domain
VKFTPQIPAHWWKTSPLQPFSPEAWAEQRPTYARARPELIRSTLSAALRRPSGNWYVIAASRDITTAHPFGTTVAGVEIVAWRDTRGNLHAGPGACPHLGADLATAHVSDDALICRWHGLRIDSRCSPRWERFPSYDDGVLAWVRLDTVVGEPPTDAPVLGTRPADTRVHAVAALTGVCEPADIIANRLDPWHGAWFHPYSFARLEVTETPTPDNGHRIVTAVTFRVSRHLGVPVEAEFVCPDPRTVVMRILSGEGAGSVVETHATPVGPGADGHPRTIVIEAIIATSARPGFRVAHHAVPLLRPLMSRAAARLWRDDLAYAERLYQLRDRTMENEASRGAPTAKSTPNS